MKVILLRHGQTDGNRKGCYNGCTDEPLCGEGLRQAERAGILPRVAKVYVSPMLRARQTAAVCFPNAKQVVIDDLREMNFGDFEGRTADEMAEDRAYRAWVDGNCEGLCPNGESIGTFCERVNAAFAQLVQVAAGAGEKKLYLTAHGGTLMAIMSRLVKQPNSYYDWYVKNCCGWQGEVELSEKLLPLELIGYVQFERLSHEEDV